MKTHYRTMYAAAWLILVAPVAAASEGIAARGEPQEVRTATVSVQVSNRSPSAPLEMRVSVQYVNSKAAEILEVLVKAAGLTMEVASAPPQPVTLTLNNVRLKTALDAICDTASCTWRLDGTTIKVASSGSSSTAQLPPTVSLSLEQVAVPDVFRALGTALGVPVIIEGQLDRPPVSIKFTNSPTTWALDYLCKNAGCTWVFDGTSREIRVRFKAP